jgi:hypothetical protein
MLCVEGHRSPKVILRSTNFGNCGGCEWEDDYSINGKFLDTNRKKFGATNRVRLKPKSSKAERNDIKLTKDGKVFEISKTYIDRTHKE